MRIQTNKKALLINRIYLFSVLFLCTIKIITKTIKPTRKHLYLYFRYDWFKLMMYVAAASF